MFRFLKYYFRSLSKRKLLSIITIGGFAISMAVVLLLIIYITEERNVNKSISDAENIYRLKRGEETLVPEGLLTNVKNEVPGVRNLCMYSINDRLFKIDDTKTNLSCLAANDAFLDIFSLDLIYRASDPTLEVKDHIILTQSFCKKWFGDKNPVGEVFKDEYTDFKIVGVVSDPPKNSSLNFDVIISLERGFALWVGSKEDSITHKLFNSFIQLHESVDPNVAGSQISKVLNRWHLFKDDKILLQQLKEVYFDTTTPGDFLLHSNVSMLYLLTSIAFLILVMAIFNYINLNISSGYQRIKEIGIKKTTGATKKNIFLQFLSEGLVVTFFSFLFAILIAAFLSPVLSEILGKEISLHSLISMPGIWLPILTIFFLTGIISGIFPALAFSYYSPLQMVTKKITWKKNSGKGGVVAIQFAIAIILVASGLFIEKQINYIKHKDLGFNKEMIVRLNLEGEARKKPKILKEKLLANPNIMAVAGSEGSIMDFQGHGEREIEVDGKTETVDFRMFNIDDNFLDLFGLELVKGENINYQSNKPTCLINEKYYKHLGWEDFVGKEIYQTEVVGIVKDFNFDNLHKKIGFLVLEKSYMPSIFSIKIRGDISENLAYIKKCCHEIEPSITFDYTFYDDWIQRMYEKEEKQAKAVRIFALFALAISCFGLIGLIELTTIRKIKEIGIRKVNGAKISEILAMLNRDFVKWVAIAFIIATPVAYYAMNKWLENFAYKTELNWWIFALAGLLALGIALLTVSWQSWRAATRNPVEALRYE